MPAPSPSEWPRPCDIVAYNFRDDTKNNALDSKPSLKKQQWRPAIVTSVNTDNTLNLMVIMDNYLDHGVEDDEGHWWPGMIPRTKVQWGPGAGQWKLTNTVSWNTYKVNPDDIPDTPTPFLGV